MNIAYILKDSDIHLSTKQVHQELLIKEYLISSLDLSNKISQKINQIPGSMSKELAVVIVIID